ncbi:metallophosphoesterase [Granulicella sp. 5B5]|uniref:metallophosphoesterase family protein n=1 Tax=Granulicella sp. 5B5 TaxID=1617967 RepID=UPI0015F638AA|nr:metallophosphoesterase family protein [Granulicella sp. 5B5]QMV18527.1 metallophosphoesterase [Granulicella sp. 5B5]
MRALVISDIHGNFHALEAVLAAAPAHDAVWNLGDVVGYGARPNEVVELLRGISTLDVRGNHDRVCTGLTSSQGFNPVAAEAAAWTHGTLTDSNLEWLKAMPKGPVAVGETIVCAHGSPLHEDHYILSMRDAWAPLQRMESSIAFFGHTHVQGNFSLLENDWEEERPQYAEREAAAQQRLELRAGTKHLINPGSVGQPRDMDWRAAFAIYDDMDSSVTFHRVPYDVEAAQAAIRAAKLPERLAARLQTGR